VIDRQQLTRSRCFGFSLVNQGLIDIEEDHHCCAALGVALE
jgi:hypothetical protein